MRIRQTAERAVRRAAFTLMEMLVVVAIIVIIAGMAVPAVMGYLEQAKFDTAKSQILQLLRAAEAYEARHSELPPNLAVLCESDGTSRAVIQLKDLKDPWGGDYIYEPQNRHPQTLRPKIYSLGPMKQGDERLNSWNL